MDPQSPEAIAKCEAVVADLNDRCLARIPKLKQQLHPFALYLFAFQLIGDLAGYRFPDVDSEVDRFKSFVAAYFPAEYLGREESLWELRNGMTAVGLLLLHPHTRFLNQNRGACLKAFDGSDFLGETGEIALRYFDAVHTNPEIRARMLRWIAIQESHPKSGG